MRPEKSGKLPTDKFPQDRPKLGENAQVDYPDIP